MKTEPLNVNQLKALDKGLKRSEPVKKEPIKLTFYSGKLWHSDKPWNALLSLDEAWKDWLSTAYEVVNPLGIPGVEPGLETDSPRYFNMKTLVDGDEITLPDNYIVSLSRNKSGIIATIVGPPDQPDNSAHREHCGGMNCPFEYSCKDGCMFPALDNKIVVEPSESQEETQQDVRITLASNVIMFLATYIHGINAGKDKALLNTDFDNAFDQYNRLITVHSKDEKFTIIRK